MQRIVNSVGGHTYYDPANPNFSEPVPRETTITFGTCSECGKPCDSDRTTHFDCIAALWVDPE